MKPTVRDVERAVCFRFNLTRADMMGPNRERRYARPRQIAMYLARQMAGASLPKIGKHFDRDHTTVLHAERRIASLAAQKPHIAEWIEECRAAVKPWRAQYAPPPPVEPIYDGPEPLMGLA